MSAGQLYPDCQTSDTGDKIIKLAGAVLRRYEVPGHTADDVATYVAANKGSDATFGLHTGRAERPGGDEHSRVQGGERRERHLAMGATICGSVGVLPLRDVSCRAIGKYDPPDGAKGRCAQKRCALTLAKVDVHAPHVHMHQACQ